MHVAVVAAQLVTLMGAGLSPPRTCAVSVCESPSLPVSQAKMWEKKEGDA